MNITIVGGGNIGTQFAVHCAEKMHQVVIFTSKPERFSKHLIIEDRDGNITHEGEIVSATSDEKVAFQYADVVLVTTPAYCMKDVAKKLYPYIHSGMKIGLIPGTGGGECIFRKCMDKGAVIFGLQRVPGVARLTEYGKRVCATGYRKELHVAALPGCYTEECCSMISNIFDMSCIGLPNYLNLTLTPSNPILHTTRLRTIFKEYKLGVTYDYIPLFYEEWDDESSKLLLECDNEVQQLCSALKNFDLSYVKSLRSHYESETTEQLTKKISGIPSLKGLKTPMVWGGDGYVPDLNSRYFVADFSYGLSILIQIAGFVGVAVPKMKGILEWYYSVMNGTDGFLFREYGIECSEDFRKFYMQ